MGQRTRSRPKAGRGHALEAGQLDWHRTPSGNANLLPGTHHLILSLMDLQRWVHEREPEGLPQRSLEHSGSWKRQSKHNTLYAALVTIAATLTLLVRRSPGSLVSLKKSPWVPGSLLLVSVRARYRRSRPGGMATDPGSADAAASAARGRRRQGAVGLACGTLGDGSGQSGTAVDRPS